MSTKYKPLQFDYDREPCQLLNLFSFRPFIDDRRLWKSFFHFDVYGRIIFSTLKFSTLKSFWVKLFGKNATYEIIPRLIAIDQIFLLLTARWWIIFARDIRQSKLIYNPYQGCQVQKKLKGQIWPCAVSKRPNPQNFKRKAN
jgi:hypothetical protein